MSKTLLLKLGFSICLFGLIELIARGFFNTKVAETPLEALLGICVAGVTVFVLDRTAKQDADLHTTWRPLFEKHENLSVRCIFRVLDLQVGFLLPKFLIMS